MSAQPESVLLIANPAAGTYTADMADAVRRRFAGSGLDVTLALTDHPGHAGKLAARTREPGGPGVVVSLGGDGTAHEVVSGLADEAAGPPGPPPALLVLPSGTGNSFYREIWADRPGAKPCASRPLLPGPAPSTWRGSPRTAPSP